MFCRYLQHQFGSWIRHSSKCLIRSKASPLLQSPACYISQSVDRLRYMQKLKENDRACQDVLTEGYFSIFCDLKPILSKEGILWKSYADVIKLLPSYNTDPLRDSVFLTIEDAETPPKFAINVSSGQRAEQSKEFEDKMGEVLGGRTCPIRKAMFVLPQRDVHSLSLAYSLLHWHSQTGFCSCCGQATLKDTAGYKRTCTSCSQHFYPTVQPIAITLVTDGDRCLLARQPRFPPQMYSALAGFCEPGESLATTVHREVAEEVGLEVDWVRYHDSQPWSFPSTGLMLGCYAQLREGTSDEIKIDKAELEEARWITRGELQSILCNDCAPNIGLVGGPDIYIPPPLAIGNQLITTWTFGE